MTHRNIPAVLAQATSGAMRLRSLSSYQRGMRILRILFPSLITPIFATVAHAQGTMDFSGAQTLMGTFNVGAPAIQSKIVLTNPPKVVAKQSM